MQHQKKNLNSGDRVKFINTGSNQFDNKTGIIVGISFINVIDSYIVMLDEPIVWSGEGYRPFCHKAITMTEVCLERIDSASGI